MFEWFKRLSISQSRKNIATILHELIKVANQADANINKTHGTNAYDIKAVKRVQERLAIELCGPIPLLQMKTGLIEPALAAPEVSECARLAVLHVYYTVYAQLGNGESEPSPGATKDNQVNQADEHFETTFFRGKIRFLGGDEQLSRYELEDGSAEIVVPNSIHVRLLTTIAMPPVYEIVAPMTHLIVERGAVPETYKIRQSHSYYRELEAYFVPLQLADLEKRMGGHKKG